MGKPLAEFFALGQCQPLLLLFRQSLLSQGLIPARHCLRLVINNLGYKLSERDPSCRLQLESLRAGIPEQPMLLPLSTNHLGERCAEQVRCEL